MFWSVSVFIRVFWVGERVCGSGRFSNVYLADLIEPETRKVAIKNSWEPKNVAVAKDQVYPEIEVLSHIPPHPNVVTLLYHFTRKIDKQVIHCLVLDYFPDDVQKLREKGIRFDTLDAQLYSYQLFSAVNCLCNCKIIHLDIKPSNLVLNHAEGVLKLADFGNAVHFGTVGTSPYQVTRYYRPPELLFGSTILTPAIDVWSAACVTYDFITTRPLFKGRNSEDQVKIIVSVLGYPTAEEVKAMASSRPRVHRSTGRGLDKYVGADFDAIALSLLRDVLVYDPSKRKTAAEVLKHDYFEPLRQMPPPKRSNGNAIPPLAMDRWRVLSKEADEGEDDSPTHGNN
nr:Serine threonine protein kinase-related domain containing protein [Haemonchus contortus]